MHVFVGSLWGIRKPGGLSEKQPLDFGLMTDLLAGLLWDRVFSERASCFRIFRVPPCSRGVALLGDEFQDAFQVASCFAKPKNKLDESPSAQKESVA